MNTIILIIVGITALIFSIGFLMLVFNLIPAIQQLRIFLADAEKTSFQVRQLSEQLQRVSDQVEEKIVVADHVLDSSKKVVKQAEETFRFLNKNVLSRSAGLLAFIPAIRFGWKLVKKIKGDK